MRRGPATVLLAGALAAACSATARHRVLDFCFDGVPPVAPARPAGGPQAAAALRPQAVAVHEHGPYAARMCGACHVSGASNALVATGGELCVRCHELRWDRRYVHGPVASGGGCLVCHDPHSSPHEHLLVAESSAFCLRCHDGASVAAVGAHADASGRQCTACHDAHASDRPHLLR